MMASRTQLIASLFVLHLAGHEAARVATTSKIAEVQLHNQTAPKPDDLDWRGCGKQTSRLPMGTSCSDLEECKWQYIWMDVGRQSCRYSEEHKMKPENQLKFLQFEVARLLYKSEVFKKTGCIYGLGLSYRTYGFKCYRRMVQMQRSLQYVRKVRAAAEKESGHPIATYVNSEEYNSKMREVGDNMFAGFEKFGETTSGMSSAASYSKSWQALLKVDTAEKKVCKIPEEDKKAQESAEITVCIMESLGAEVNSEQKDAILAMAQEHQALPAAEDDFDVQSALDAMDEDAHNTYLASVDDDESSARSAVEDVDDDSDEDEFSDERSFDDEWNNASYYQVGQVASLLQAEGRMTTTGKGPIKWLFQNGLGWVFRRLTWLVLFSLGAALNVIRAGVVFPLAMVSCILLKSLKFLTVDLFYWLGWEGDLEQFGKGFKSIVKCPKEMWHYVGFEASSLSQVPGAVFIPPAAFASHVTGVVHPWKSAAGLCDGVKCGTNAVCHAGRCHCKLGFYPNDQDAKRESCAEVTSKHGCRCYPSWQRPEALGLWNSSAYFGCPATLHTCKVDQTHESYATCKGQLKKKQNWAEWMTSDKSVYDSCEAVRAQQEVRRVKD
eukprot:TRINITY_DN103160_c0_g1_i1.p1 TRINITY_DN103160_c0_g1~~TRINITY_DN103160_c0_g1_i1.p1  ORF type:complete len:632 (+),score=146.31 TRINITY_DN103160_c0_g1_i1:74-1897(+)